MQKSSVLLVVEDDPNIRMIVVDILESEGYRVTEASNGEEALKIVSREKPGLILLDLQMPIMTGRDFMKELKANSIAVPIIVMSAQITLVRQSLELGAVDYLDKPFDLEELLSKVAQYVKPA